MVRIISHHNNLNNFMPTRIRLITCIISHHHTDFHRILLNSVRIISWMAPKYVSNLTKIRRVSGRTTTDVVREQGRFYSDGCKKMMNQYDLGLMKSYLRPGFRVLDVGCGTGEFSLHAFEVIGSSGFFLGIDQDEERIEIARENANHLPNAKFMVCKGPEIPLDENTFDFAISNLVFDWMDREEKRATLKNVFSGLKVDGVFLIQFTNPIPSLCLSAASFLGKEKEHVIRTCHHEMSLVELAKMSEDIGFKVISKKIFDVEKNVETLKDLGQFLTGLVNGLIDFTQVENILEREGKGIPQSWVIDGVISGTINQMIICKTTIEQK